MTKIYRENLKRLLENIPNMEGKKLWIWGAGNTALLYQNGMQLLEREGIVIEGYCDQNPLKQGTCLGEKPIISPEELFAKENVCVLICTQQSCVIEEISKKLSDRHIAHYLLDEVILKLHRAEVLECFDNFEDAYSQEVYAEVIGMRVCGRYPEERIVTEEDEYFAHEMFKRANDEEIFIDAGAYVGDTVEAYIANKNGRFGKILAFEPDQKNYEGLEQTVSEIKAKRNLSAEKIQIYPYALAEKKMNLSIECEHQGAMTSKIMESPHFSRGGRELPVFRWMSLV